MIGDARNIVYGATIETELCIIGAGAAGVTLALELLEAGIRIVLLEAGGADEEAESQALYKGEVAEYPLLHSPPERYRQRRFGGSTAIWGGRCVPLDPIDFEHRPWLPGSGWPIAYQDVAAHYPRANAGRAAGEAIYDAGLAVPGGMRPLIKEFSPADFTTGRIERFSCPTDFGKRYRHKLAAADSCGFSLHANCTRRSLRRRGRMSRATVR